MRTRFEGNGKPLLTFALFAGIGSVVLVGCAKASNETVGIENIYQDKISSTVYVYGNARNDPRVIEDTASGEENRCFNEGAWLIPEGTLVYTNTNDQDINGPWWGVSKGDIVFTGGNDCKYNADGIVWVSTNTIN